VNNVQNTLSRDFPTNEAQGGRGIYMKAKGDYQDQVHLDQIVLVIVRCGGGGGGLDKEIGGQK
jgi:hypothetical protein